MSLTTTLRLSIAATVQAVMGVAPVTGKLTVAPEYAWSDGSGPDQADLLYSATLSIETGSPLVLNLSDGSLTDPLRRPVVFTRVRLVAIFPYGDAALPIRVGGAATHPWIAPFADAADPAGTIVRVEWEGALLLLAPDAAGYPVVAGVSDQLAIATDPAATAQGTADLILIGTSA